MSPESDLLLPAGARLIHIGPHKTGSTAIQVGLQAAADELVQHGVHYATGPRHRPDKAGWALGIRGRPAGSERPPMKFWNRLVADVARHPDERVCISNEDFGRARPEEIRTLVADLGGADAHVVAVARRFDRYLPSQWQERVKAGDRRGYDEWLRTVLDTSDEFDWDRRNVWFSHDTAALVGRWVERGRSGAVHADRQRRVRPRAAAAHVRGVPRPPGRHHQAGSQPLQPRAELERDRADPCRQRRDRRSRVDPATASALPQGRGAGRHAELARRRPAPSRHRCPAGRWTWSAS